MDEIIKHDEGQVPVKVKLASLPSVAQANVKEQEYDVITPFSIHINRAKWGYDKIILSLYRN